MSGNRRFAARLQAMSAVDAALSSINSAAPGRADGRVRFGLARQTGSGMAK